MKTVIEVGANFGTDTQRFLSEPDNIVYAFEPTPELNLHLKDKFQQASNFFPIPMAVDLENGWKWFNIAGTNDWGCSSLHSFNPNIAEEWAGRPDFHFTDRCRVMTIRLDTFMDIYNIHDVSYLWIDAQGNDFKVLQSLGSKIDLVREGRCEAAYSVNLYANVDNTVDSILNWLGSRGFNCVVDAYNGKEADVHFKQL
jgi:FkbM family methyltransferase